MPRWSSPLPPCVPPCGHCTYTQDKINNGRRASDSSTGLKQGPSGWLDGWLRRKHPIRADRAPTWRRQDSGKIDFLRKKAATKEVGKKDEQGKECRQLITSHVMTSNDAPTSPSFILWWKRLFSCACLPHSRSDWQAGHPSSRADNRRNVCMCVWGGGDGREGLTSEEGVQSPP